LCIGSVFTIVEDTADIVVLIALVVKNRLSVVSGRKPVRTVGGVSAAWIAETPLSKPFSIDV